MDKKSKSKVNGASSDVDAKAQSAMPSTNGAHPSPTSAMLANTPSQKNQITFQPTQALGEIDEPTANSQIIFAFAAKLGALVVWKRLELGDGQEVIALCFPLGVWEVSPNGALGIKKKAS